MADDSIFAGPAVPIGQKSGESDDSPFAGPAVPIKPKPSFLGSVGQNLLRTAKGVMDINTSDVAESFGAGVAESATGIGELIPGLHEPSARASAYLHSQAKNPYAEAAGMTAPYLLGGEWLGAEKAASLIPKAAADAPGVLNAIGRTASSIGRGAVGGGVVGAETGAGAPTEETDWQKMAAKKAKQVEAGARGGAAIGSVLGSAAGGGRELIAGGTKAYDLAVGKSVDEAVGKLGQKVAGAASQEAGKVGKLEPRLHQEIERLDSAKGAVGDAKEAADRLEQELRAKPTMDHVEFGQRVRQLANDTYERLVKKRADESGYTAAIAEADKGPIVDTSKIQNYLDNWRRKTSDPHAETVINYVEGRIQAGDGGALRGTIEQMDSMRQVLNRLYRTQDMAAVGGIPGAKVNAYEIGQVNKLVREAIETADPRVAQAAVKFRELSRPLDPFERKGPLAGAVKTDELSDEYIGEVGKLINAILSKTEAGAATEQGVGPMALLVREDPSLKEAARKYFQFDLFGEKGEKPITPEKFTKWLADNKRALEQTGLLPEFTAARDKMESVAQTTQRLAEEVAVKQGDVEAITKSLKAPKKYARLLTELDAAAKPDRSLAQTLVGADQSVVRVAAKTREILENLNKDGLLPDTEYGALLRQVQQLEAEKINRNIAVSRLKQGALVAALVAGGSYGWEAYHIGRLFTGK